MQPARHARSLLAQARAFLRREWRDAVSAMPIMILAVAVRANLRVTPAQLRRVVHRDLMRRMR